MEKTNYIEVKYIPQTETLTHIQSAKMQGFFGGKTVIIPWEYRAKTPNDYYLAAKKIIDTWSLLKVERFAVEKTNGYLFYLTDKQKLTGKD